MVEVNELQKKLSQKEYDLLEKDEEI